jgi:hypothetical protein
MYAVNQNQIETLKAILNWRVEESCAKTNLVRATKELNNALVEAQIKGVDNFVINLILNDKNGSGVQEILREAKEVVVEHEIIQEIEWKDTMIKVGTRLREEHLAYDFIVEKMYVEEYVLRLDLLPVFKDTTNPYNGLTTEGLKVEKITCSRMYLTNKNMEVVE